MGLIIESARVVTYSAIFLIFFNNSSMVRVLVQKPQLLGGACVLTLVRAGYLP